jgi:predicted ATPase/DNA-binding SARP family transcriptional activator
LGVAEQPGLEFAGLLRQLRAEAGLTQEELAEAASLSLAAARGEAPGATTALATRTLLRDTANFTGSLSAGCPPTADGRAFEVRLLGPVRAVRLGREIALGGPKKRAVLALLLLEPGRVVPAGRLMEELWRGSSPPGAAVTLRSYVSRLRTVLGPDAVLEGSGGGYVITVQADDVDAGRFERLVVAGQAALDAGEAAAAAGQFAEALRLWHGRALADVCEVEALALESARLEELRLAAVEGRIEADIALGRHARAIGELERLVAEFPVRERLWRLLVLALYRDERQADALAAYRRARAMLAAELGLEPGEELRRLEQAVLRQEVPAARPPSRHNLPAPLTSFLGRETDLATLARLLGEARLVTLTGPGGAGKTRLAVEIGTRAVDLFPGGVWLADLTGIAGPELVAARVMEALGVRQDGDVPVMEALRFRLRSAELLLVLDNCEHLLDACAKLAGGLLRSSPGLRVLATSREPLGLPGEVTYQVRPLAVPPEDPDAEPGTATAPAVRLFLDRASAARGGSLAEAGLVAVAGRICRKLDGLPLAIELAAARMGSLSAAEIEANLSDRFRFLAYRRPAADPRHQALRAAMDWSYELLSPEERGALQQLSVFAGSAGLAQAAEVCTGGDVAAALDVIDRLAAKSLVTAETDPDGTRYQLLETVRQYAADRLAEAGGTWAARQRHALAYLHLAHRERGQLALARDHDNFRAALEWSLAQGGDAGPRLAHALGAFWLAQGMLAEGRDWLERALAQLLTDQSLRAGLLRLLGATLFESGELDRAEAVLAEGSTSAARASASALQARIGVLLADVRNMLGRGNAETLADCEAAIAILQAEADLEGLAEAWMLTGRARFWLDDPAASAEALERAIAYARQGGHHRAQMRASHWLAVTFRMLPLPADAAIARIEELLQASSGDSWAEADLLKPLCILYAYVGRAADARAALARSRAIFVGFGAKFPLAESGIPAGVMELALADPAAAERYLREAHAALRAMSERRYLITVTAELAEALYAQGRFDEAQYMAGEIHAAGVPDADAWSGALNLRAMLLARRGQFPTARRMLAEAEALITPASSALTQAKALIAKAEVDQLAGTPDQAAASLRAALRIYEDRRATQLAAQIRAALASIAVPVRRSPG